MSSSWSCTADLTVHPWSVKRVQLSSKFKSYFVDSSLRNLCAVDQFLPHLVPRLYRKYRLISSVSGPRPNSRARSRRDQSNFNCRSWQGSKEYFGPGPTLYWTLQSHRLSSGITERAVWLVWPVFTLRLTTDGKCRRVEVGSWAITRGKPVHVTSLKEKLAKYIYFVLWISGIVVK